MSSDSAALALLLFGFLLLFRQQFASLFARLLGRVLESVPPRTSTTAVGILRRLYGQRWRVYWSLVAARAHRRTGRTSEALTEFMSVLPDLGQTDCPWDFVNEGADLLVSAGRYHDALDLPRRWPKHARARGRTRNPAGFVLTRINQAEALHNLGRDDEALLRLRRVARQATGHPLALSGLRCLRAWIHVHRGELDAAREELAHIDERALAQYRPEVCYTRAALEREVGNLKGARHFAKKGLDEARRASSVRNGQYMLAGILALSREFEAARAIFEQGAGHAYRGQGGDGLWRFAVLLGSNGQREEAIRVFQLVIERDPESTYASRASRELAAYDAVAAAVPNSCPEADRKEKAVGQDEA